MFLGGGKVAKASVDGDSSYLNKMAKDIVEYLARKTLLSERQHDKTTTFISIQSHGSRFHPSAP
jgi:lantibiotic modifying enzyme